MHCKNKILVLFTVVFIAMSIGCVKKSRYSKGKDNLDFEEVIPQEQFLLKQEDQTLIKPIKKKAYYPSIKNDELDFFVENKTGKTIYVACFSYIKSRVFSRWRWDKSKVYKVDPNQMVLVDIDKIEDKQEIKNIYGSLAVFDSIEEAEGSTYELLNEKHKIDLDHLYRLKNKKVTVGIEKYGSKKELLDLKINPINNNGIAPPELDFMVQNKTGKPLWITCFVYQKKDDMPIWKHDKTEVQYLPVNKTVMIDIDSISKKYNRVFMRGFLGIFEKNEKNKAEKSIFELLDNKNKISIGRLAALKNKKIVLEVEKYGYLNDFLDFSIEPL